MVRWRVLLPWKGLMLLLLRVWRWLMRNFLRRRVLLDPFNENRFLRGFFLDAGEVQRTLRSGGCRGYS